MITHRPIAAIRMLACLFCILGFIASCSRINYFPRGADVQTGIASWYGSDFHGRRTSNKEIYNMFDMTAAHRTLPFGTRVMVTNLNNGRTTSVRINDRGPFVGDRIIDLSYAAACLIDMVGCGIAPVRVEVLRNLSPPSSSLPVYSIQVGSFIYEDHAKNLETVLRKKYRNVYIASYETPRQIYYRVRIKAKNVEASKSIAQKLCEDGYKVLILEEE